MLPARGSAKSMGAWRGIPGAAAAPWPGERWRDVQGPRGGRPRADQARPQQARAAPPAGLLPLQGPGAPPVPRSLHPFAMLTAPQAAEHARKQGVKPRRGAASSNAAASSSAREAGVAARKPSKNASVDTRPKNKHLRNTLRQLISSGFE